MGRESGVSKQVISLGLSGVQWECAIVGLDEEGEKERSRSSLEEFLRFLDPLRRDELLCFENFSKADECDRPKTGRLRRSCSMAS